MRVLIAVTIMVCGLTASSLAQQPGPAAVPVGTVTAARKPITDALAHVYLLCGFISSKLQCRGVVEATAVVSLFQSGRARCWAG